MNTQRAHLLQQSITEEMHKLNEAGKFIIMPQCADDNELASCYEATHIHLLLMQHVQKKLRHLTQSIATIESHPHTQCLDCGEEISVRRLQVVSDAVRCTSCQEEWEDDMLKTPA